MKIYRERKRGISILMQIYTETEREREREDINFDQIYRERARERDIISDEYIYICMCDDFLAAVHSQVAFFVTPGLT